MIPPTPTNTVGTIAELRQVAPTEDAALLVLGYHTPGDGGGGVFRADCTPGAANEVDDGGMTIAPNNSLPGRWKRVYAGPISVRFFGARDLGDSTGGAVAAANRAAIQAAIDFAVNPTDAHSAAVITFPASTSTQHGGVAEYKVDGALVLPRLPYYAYMVLRGDGQRVSQITRTTAGPLMICNQDPANKSNGSFLIEHLTLALEKPDSRAFDWTPPVDGDFSRPEIHFNEMLFKGSNSSIDGLVRIRRGHRCRLYNCEFSGLDPDGNDPFITTGVAIWLENCGGTTIINARNIGNYGALVKCTGGGELVMINCRSEGAKGVPGWDFENVKHITLIEPSNEGKREAPAVFRFRNCVHVILINPGLATPDSPMQSDGTTYADGISFESCTDFTVLHPYTTASFTQLGEALTDSTARAIRIDADCRHGFVRGLHCNHLASDIDVENLGQDCYIEALSDARGVVGMGKLVADALRASNGFAQFGSPLPAHPTGHDLEIGGGNGWQPGVDLAGNTIIQLGQPNTAGNTAQLLLQKGPDDAMGRLWYQTGPTLNQNYLKLESLGTALHLRSASDLVLEQAAAMIALKTQGDLTFTAGFNGTLPTFTWCGNGGNTTRPIPCRTINRTDIIMRTPCL